MPKLPGVGVAETGSDAAQKMTDKSVRKRPQPPSLERQIDMLRSPVFLVNPH